MNYTLNYHIATITYRETDNIIKVAIVNEDTGEVFEGEAEHHAEDEMNIARYVNLATARAVREALRTSLEDDEQFIIENGSEFQFNN